MFFECVHKIIRMIKWMQTNKRAPVNKKKREKSAGVLLRKRKTCTGVLLKTVLIRTPVHVVVL